jgi:hypothetical protein
MKTYRCADCGTELARDARGCPVCARNVIWERRAVLLIGAGATFCLITALALIEFARLR